MKPLNIDNLLFSRIVSSFLGTQNPQFLFSLYFPSFFLSAALETCLTLCRYRGTGSVAMYVQCKYVREAVLPINPCQCFLPSPKGFLLSLLSKCKMSLERCLRGCCFPSSQITIWQIPVQQDSTGEDEHSDGNWHIDGSA